MLGAPQIHVGTLFDRLKTVARNRVRNGDFTERGLARLIGVSQPHLHNVLQGRRALTPEVADLLLEGLDTSLLDLLEDRELASLLEARPRQSVHRPVAVAAGRLGPEHAFPDLVRAAEWLYLPAGTLQVARRPVVVELGDDPTLPAAFAHGGYALIDQDERARLRLAGNDWFALRWNGVGFVRQLRRDGTRLIVRGQQAVGLHQIRDPIPLDEQSLLYLVRGRVLWLGPDPRRTGPFDYAGEWLATERS